MKLLIGFFSLVLLLASQCQPTPEANTFIIGEPFVLEPATVFQAQAADLKVEALRISEDSRCPKGTTCVWEGQAIVSFLVNKEAMNLTLQAGDPSLAVKRYAGYRFEAQQLTPYPVANITPDTNAYQLTLLVQKIP